MDPIHDIHLAAKLAPPRQMVALVERPELAPVAAGLDARALTLVRTPAGYGKTTLLTQWWAGLGEGDRHRAWVTLEPEDRQPLAFLSGIVAALRRSGVEVAEVVQNAERTMRDLPASFVLRMLLRDIEAAARPIILMLDDYHLVESSDNDALMGFLLRNRPDHLHLVVAMRSRPGFPVSALRLAGALVEVTEAALRFTPAQVQHYFAGRLGTDDIAHLVDRTEGWPVALQLVRLWLDQQGDVAQWVRGFTGSRDEMAAYIAEQVVAGLPDNLRDFLAATAILERVNGELADAVCGTQDGWSLLEELARRNSLIFPLDREGQWFRYHQLLREFLAGWLRRHRGRDLAQLHANASRWYEARGQLVDAVRHAALAEDMDRVVALIGGNDCLLVLLSRGAHVVDAILAHVPAHVAAREPRIQVAQALRAAKRGQLVEARNLSDAIRAHHRAADPARPDPVEADLLVMEGLLAAYQDNRLPPARLEALEIVGARLNSGDYYQGFVNNILCIMHYRQGEVAFAGATAATADRLFVKVNSSYGRIFIAIHQGFFFIERLRLEAADEALDRAQSMAHADIPDDRRLHAIIQVYRAALFHERGEREPADELILEGLRGVEEGEGWVEVFVTGYRTAAGLAFARAGLDAALAILDRGEDVARARALPRLSALLLGLRIDLLRRAGRVAEARALADTTGFSVTGTHCAQPDLIQRLEAIEAGLTLASLALAEGAPDQALTLLAPLGEPARAGGFERGTARIQLLRALALAALGRLEETVPTLRQLLATTREEGARQIFIDQGTAVIGLLRQLVAQVGAAGLARANLDWIAELLVALGDRDGSGDASLPALLLTPREREILSSLAAGGSNKVIARRLDMTDNAVKFHLKNIFRKLGANDRKLALAIAERQGFLG
ncbi:LuxR C-terminal-related transcriptional regulator [Niveispirillum sp. KHB5.9]|uniref:LuxR C-terminal-related transcriptional regulator n=1 Tax=Niveispirillum sp. KHB5.9 TaxID=3400269 RepID=UPI003A83B045